MAIMYPIDDAVKASDLVCQTDGERRADIWQQKFLQAAAERDALQTKQNKLLFEVAALNERIDSMTKSSERIALELQSEKLQNKLLEWDLKEALYQLEQQE